MRDGIRLRRHDDRPDGQVTEPGQTCLKRQISQDVWPGRPPTAQGRALKSVAIAAGPRDNGACLDSLTPDIRWVDVGQAGQVSQGRGRCR